MSISFLYYALFLITFSFGDVSSLHHRPINHMQAVQVFYFYDSRLPSEYGDKMCELTEHVLHSTFEKQMNDGKIIYYKVDLSSPKGRQLASKCNISLTGLMVSQGPHVTDLTENAYSMVRSEPIRFQEHLAYVINDYLPRKYRVENGQ